MVEVVDQIPENQAENFRAVSEVRIAPPIQQFRPLAQAFIQGSYDPEVVLYEMDECPICIDPFEDVDHVTTLENCRHVFHTHCIV